MASNMGDRATTPQQSSAAGSNRQSGASNRKPAVSAKRLVPRGNAFTKDVLRTVRGTIKRFVALAVITALGVTMLTGLKASCDDLRRSADSFFDAQNLFDIRVQSTLGLTDDDIDALAALDGVEAVEGGWSETVYSQVGNASEKVEVRALSDSGMNAPRVVEGHLPERDDQIAVTERFLRESGLYIGDTITFHGAEDDESDDADSTPEDDNLDDVGSTDSSTEVFERKEYTIIATVLDPMNINGGEGAMNFRASGGTNYTFFVTDGSVINPDVYTAAYVTVEGADTPLCYSDEYDQIVDEVKQSVEDARVEREQARGAGLRADATEQVNDAEAEALVELGRAEDELNDAQAEIDSGRAQLDSAEAELAANGPQVQSGLQQIANGLGCSVAEIPATVTARQAEIDAGSAQLSGTRSQLEASASMLSSLPYVSDIWPADAWARLSSTTDPATASAIANSEFGSLNAFVSDSTAALDEVITYLSDPEVQDELENGLLTELMRAYIRQLVADAPASIQSLVESLLNTTPAEIISQLSQVRNLIAQLSNLAPGMAQVIAGEAELAAGRAQLQQAINGYNQLVSAQDQIASGWGQVNSGRAELDAGQAELDEGRATFEAERDDALNQIADARAQIDDIPDAVWYVQDRSSLASYASVDSDASSIEAIGAVIPVVFFVVAVLISLTTMTRMVEEERGFIGIYKALGYRRGRILSKYALYALAACIVGGVAGALAGFLVLPAIIFTIFKTMYALPALSFGFDPAQLALSIVLFAAGIVGATLLACIRELRESPASLMRPKAPRAGSRIFLEHIGPVWRRLGFLNKVTARNLFRYKRRLLMTVFGVAGCVALLITGFGIRDTVISLSARQYGDTAVSRYDLLAVANADDLDGVVTDLESAPEVDRLIRAHIDNVTVTFDNKRETMQMIVVADDAPIENYLHLTHEDGTPITLADTGAVITKNAEQVLGVTPACEVELQDSTLATGNVEIADIALNYLSNMVILTESTYEDAFGEPAEQNGVLATLNGSDDEQIAFGETLNQDDRLLNVVTTATLVRDFSVAFTLINTVVYVVIVLAAALAFTVVFTLSNTNISERERELATIKVLGFRRREVYRYINKETLILTGMGVVVGMPMGYALARSLTWILKMPSLYFDVTVEPLTYVISAVLAFAFTLMVNLITNRSLDRIDMVGALKSAE